MRKSAKHPDISQIIEIYDDPEIGWTKFRLYSSWPRYEKNLNVSYVYEFGELDAAINTAHLEFITSRKN